MEQKAVRIRIDAASGGRTYEGVGGITSNGMSKLMMEYPEDVLNDIFELLFKPGAGAALQHLKTEIGSDVNTSCGTEPSHMRSEDDFDIRRGVGLDVLRRAKALNPALPLDALRWGLPSWITDDEKKWLFYRNFLQGAKDEFGIEFDYLGPDMNEGSFSRDWTVNTLRPRLDSHGFGHIRLVADDSDHGWDIADAVMEDPALNEAVYAMGVHYRQDSTDNAKNSGKPLWLSEDLAPFRHSFVKGALDVGERIAKMYADGRMVKYELHPLVEAEYNDTPFSYKGILVANWPWSGHYELDPGFWVIAHYTRFAEPGWTYLDDACGVTKHGAYVALRSPDGADYTVVAVNKSEASQLYEFDLASLPDAPLYVWRTTAVERLEPIARLDGPNALRTLRLAPQSIYTLTTKARERMTLPASLQRSETRFPLPYADDFAGYRLGGQPRYTSDQGGAFEIGEAGGERCLVQTIDAAHKPIDWTYRRTPEPYTLLGSLEWAQYQVSVDVRLDGAEGYAMLGGRIAYTAKSDEPPEGYLLAVGHDGAWTLRRGQAPLAEGTLPAYDGREWLTLRLAFDGDRILAYAGGALLAGVRDAALSSGHIALGSGYHRALFRRLRVEPLAEGVETDCKRYDDRDARLSFGGAWEAADGDFNVWARTLRRTETAGDKLTFRFDGTAVSVIGKLAPNGGRADVYVDGMPAGAVDTYAAAASFRKSIFSAWGLSPGVHEVSLIVRGEGGAAAEGRWIHIDAVETYGGEGLA